MVKIVISRQNNYYNCLSAFSIYVDNAKVGTLPNGEVREFSVFNGKHELYVKNMFDKSNVLSFDTNDFTMVYIDCRMGILNPKLKIREVINTATKIEDYERLSKLKELKEKNILSEDEYLEETVETAETYITKL